MTQDYDREKILSCMFDPVTSEIIAQLEDGPKELSLLAQTASLSESEVMSRLEYLLEHNFLTSSKKGSTIVISANTAKLNGIIENSDNFDAAIDGLIKMDSYLN